MQIAMVQDKIVPLSGLDPAHLDRGTFFGDGVYEVLRSYGGRIFALDEHLDRFAASLAAVGIRGADIDSVRRRVLEAFEAAGAGEAKIYFHVTRGSAPRDHLCDENLRPNFFLTVTALRPDPAVKQAGIAVSTHPDWRWKRCDIKSLNLLANVLARRDAAEKGCAEAVLVDDSGLITEGAGSAFFAVFGRRLQTAPLTANILPSITRRFVIEAAANIGLEVVEESLSPDRAAEADELFIGVTTQDVVPVTRFDAKQISSGRCGECTKRLCEQFLAFTRR
jgi:D-alanine transaminase